MITEIIRIVSDWIADGTYGVNAMMAGLPVDTGVTRPTVTIYDSTRNDEVARGDVPSALGVGMLVTSGGTPVTQKGNRNVPRDYAVDVLIRMVTTKTATAAAINDASLMVRALQRSIERLQDTSIAPAQAARLRGSLQLVALDPMESAALYEQMGGAFVTYAVRYGCSVRELLT